MKSRTVVVVVLRVYSIKKFNTVHLPCFVGSASCRFLGRVVINTRTRAPSGLLMLNPKC